MLMPRFFHGIIVPITPGCENVKGKRHIQLTDSAGPHVSLEHLELLEARGIRLCPRTPNLSHAQQNEDLVHFGILKLEERRERQLLQSHLLMDARRTKHSDRIVNLSFAMRCLAGPWQKAFAEDVCARAWATGGCNPFTRLPMYKMAKEQAAVKASIESAAKRRRTNVAVANDVIGLSTQDLWARVNNAKPAWQSLSDPSEVTADTKITKAALAMMKQSLSEDSAIEVIRAKGISAAAGK